MFSLPDVFLYAYRHTGLSTSLLVIPASLVLIDYLEASEFTAYVTSEFEILFHLPIWLVFNVRDVTGNIVSAVEIEHGFSTEL